MPIPLILVAAGGLAREVLGALEGQSRYRVRGILDDESSLHGTAVGGVGVLGSLDMIQDHDDAQVLICAGRGIARSAIERRLSSFGISDNRFAAVNDSSVRVPKSCRVGVGSILLGNVVMTADVDIGRHVVSMPNATLTHDDQLEDFVTVCAGVALGGAVHVGREAYLGMNSSVRENLTIGQRATLGMGACLLRDLPAGETWVGVPAHPLGAAICSSPFPHNFEVEGLSA
jgi:sugar O-acyltransferase (sialic acid O-acetyltransferase NeuD family)